MSERFEEILARDNKLVYKTKGCSMQPMLYENRDLVILETPKGRLKRYDVAFYRGGGKYVLHRVIRVKKDHYLIRGDNNMFNEHVPFDAVIGVLTGFVREGKQYSVSDRDYVLYCKKTVLLYPFRLVYKKTRRFFGRLKRRLLKQEIKS